MRIGVITATSGQRPHLMSQCWKYIDRQAVKPSVRLVLNGDETLKAKYHRGLEELKNETDIIFFMEDDDYYPPNYIEKMLEMYNWAGSPEVFGIGETYFYHPEFKAYWYYLNQDNNACAFQTCVRSDAIDKIDWNTIDDVFVDAGLWRQLKGETVRFGKPLSIGIKHGRGKCLASGHNRWFYEKKAEAPKDLKEYAEFSDTWLRDMIGEDADFYEHFGANKELI
jgi:hypothetical protein